MTMSTFDNPRDSERERNARRYDDVRDEDDTTLDEPIVARERAEERERAAARHDAAGHAMSGEPHEFGTSYLGGSTDEQWQKWRQIQADVYGHTAEIVEAEEGAAYGAAILAGVGRGAWPSVEGACASIVRVASRVAPRPDAVAALRAVYADWRRIYPALKGVGATDPASAT